MMNTFLTHSGKRKNNSTPTVTSQVLMARKSAQDDLKAGGGHYMLKLTL